MKKLKKLRHLTCENGTNSYQTLVLKNVSHKSLWLRLLYVKYPTYFQQCNLNLDITFPNLSIDTKLQFLSAGLRLYFQIYKDIFRFLNVALAEPINFSQCKKVSRPWLSPLQGWGSSDYDIH